MKNGKHLFYPQGGDILSKRFYKLYHYVAETFYPDVVDQKVCDIAFWFGDRYCDSQNKLCKLFWFIIFHTYWILSDIEQFCSENYYIGLAKSSILKLVNTNSMMKNLNIICHNLSPR